MVQLALRVSSFVVVSLGPELFMSGILEVPMSVPLL
jgi:hypothetical protein